MATTYAGCGDQLRLAQQTLDAHVTSCVDGRCRQCRSQGPCLASETAAAVFARFQALPRRVPGAAQPELLGARRLGDTSLFTA